MALLYGREGRPTTLFVARRPGRGGAGRGGAGRGGAVAAKGLADERGKQQVCDLRGHPAADPEATSEATSETA